MDIIFSNFDGVEPDLLYMSNERAAQIARGQHVNGVPELIIEIASPGTRTRDETIKRRLYERFGVTEYCVIDPDLVAVRVYRRSGNRFDPPIELSCEAHDVLTTTVLPQLDLPLTRIFGN